MSCGRSSTRWHALAVSTPMPAYGSFLPLGPLSPPAIPLPLVRQAALDPPGNFEHSCECPSGPPPCDLFVGRLSESPKSPGWTIPFREQPAETSHLALSPEGRGDLKLAKTQS